MKSELSWFLALSLFAWEAQARDCTAVFTESARSVRRDVAHMSGSTDETVDFETQTLRSVPTPSMKNGQTRQRKLGAAEVAALKETLAALCLKKAPPNGDSPPGGSFSFDIQDKDGSKRRLSYFSPERSLDFYPLSDDEAERLFEVWPGLEGPRPLPSTETRVKHFLAELLSADPSTGAGTAQVYARLDPRNELFELMDFGRSGGYAVQVQLRPRSASTLDVKALAKALEVTSPIACLANGEHGIWVLGSHEPRDTALTAWKSAELRVELLMPPKTKASSSTGETRGLDGVGVRSITLRVKAPASSSPPR